MSENKTGKYFKYAIGEIILVVIGILIALQINNWNEKRKSLITEKVTLTKFLQDLQSDSSYFQINLRRLNVIDQLQKDLFKIGFEDAEGIILKEPNYIRRQLIYHPITKENNPDIVSKIDIDGIREHIQNYYREMSNVEKANNEFSRVVVEIRSFLRTKKLHNPISWFKSKIDLDEEKDIVPDIIDPEDLKQLAKDDDFKQLLFESSLKLNETKKALDLLIQKNGALINKIRSSVND